MWSSPAEATVPATVNNIKRTATIDNVAAISAAVSEMWAWHYLDVSKNIFEMREIIRLNLFSLFFFLFSIDDMKP